MKRTIASCWVALLMMAGASAPVFAGAVYVPFATNSQLGGVRLQTQVWVTNRLAASQSFTTFYVDNNADGSARGTGGGSPIQVGAGVTQLLGPVAADGKTGLLEITGQPGFFVNARLTASTGQSVDVPVITSENVVAAGATAQVQGLERTTTRITQYGLVNVGAQAAQCTVKLSKADGVAIGAAATVTVKPLSTLLFGDLLAPATQLDGARTSATCNQPFYPYALTIDVQNGEMTFSGPSITASSTLNPPVPGGGGVQTFQRTGTFFTPARNSEVLHLELPFAKGTNFKKARVQLDVTHGGWYAPLKDGVHNFFLLAIGDDDNRLGYAAVRGPSRNFVLFHHTYGLPLGSAGNRVESNLVLQQGETYHLDYTYDLTAARITLVITRGGTEIVRATDVPFATGSFRATGSETYYMNFGLEASGPHSPTYGWKYANLKVDFTP
jgi:hypothetical protein